jgi:hypothetical protein
MRNSSVLVRCVAALAVVLLLLSTLLVAVSGVAVSRGVAEFVPVTEPLAHVVPTGNWAGYALTGKFSEVHGTFTVPSVGSNSYGALSEWVGVDGYSNSDLIQAGITENDGTDYAWWEILPSVSVPIFWMRVSAGSEITVGIRRFGGPHSWIVDIFDRNTLQFFHQQFVYAGPGDSVEWITEAPSTEFGTQIPILGYGSAITFSELTETGIVSRRDGFHDVWTVQGGSIVDIPSSVPSVNALLSDGFSTEYVG